MKDKELNTISEFNNLDDIARFLEDYILECEPNKGCGRCDSIRNAITYLQGWGTNNTRPVDKGVSEHDIEQWAWNKHTHKESLADTKSLTFRFYTEYLQGAIDFNKEFSSHPTPKPQERVKEVLMKYSQEFLINQRCVTDEHFDKIATELNKEIEDE